MCIKQLVPVNETIEVEIVWLLMHIINSTRNCAGSKPKFHLASASEDR